ncbi:MAG: acetyltransferase [Gemmatimonadaceae bacterium]
MRSIVLIGGGEHACVVAEALRSRDSAVPLLGYVDPRAGCPAEVRLGLRRLGGDEWLRDRGDVALLLGVGEVGVGDLRCTLVRRLGFSDDRWTSVVHASAVVSPSAMVGAGAVVMAGAVVQAGAFVGRYAVVNTAAVVEHDVVIGDFAQVGPGAVIGGGAHLDAGAYVALGARVRDHIRIGARALVAMGAVAVHDVRAGATVLGIPARERGDGPVRH